MSASSCERTTPDTIRNLADKSIHIVPYTPDLESRVKAFNERLQAGGEMYWRFPESHLPRFPRVKEGNFYQEFFLVMHEGEVRGGYLVTHNRFAVRGEIVHVACAPQINMTEGLVNRTYGMLGVIQVQDVIRRWPMSFALGGMPKEHPILLKAMGWTVLPVPLYFRVVSTSKFLAHISYLRESPRARLAADTLRFSGLGAIAIRAAQTRMPRSQGGLEVKEFCDFGGWADEIWERCRGEYSLVAARDSGTLNILYPESETRFLRLRVFRGSKNLGWVTLLAPRLSGHKYFGNMQVGSIVDGLASPSDVADVVLCASRFLERYGVDMIVSNQANLAWRRALFSAGFFQGPSNFLFVLSPALAEKLQPLAEYGDGIHINRGDGEGPTIL
jgi:hypothetical protein